MCLDSITNQLEKKVLNTPENNFFTRFSRMAKHIYHVK